MPGSTAPPRSSRFTSCSTASAVRAPSHPATTRSPSPTDALRARNAERLSGLSLSRPLRASCASPPGSKLLGDRRQEREAAEQHRGHYALAQRGALEAVWPGGTAVPREVGIPASFVL